MIHKKVMKGTTTELETISLEDALKLEDKSCLVFDTDGESMRFYEKVVSLYKNLYPHSKKTKTSQLSALFPYLDDEDLHEIASSILNEGEDSKYKNLDLEELAPYLDDEDIEMLFLKSISEGDGRIDPVVLAPYVSEKHLSIFVDSYLKGEYQNVDIDEIYPYLNSKDIKRVFQYYLSLRDNRS